jgi:uncharacterized protein (DUF1697 family)
VSAFIALLRAVNVGGTGKLPMTDLKRICEEAHFTSVRTYIASGNVVFESRLGEATIKLALEAGLASCAGKRAGVGVLVRSATEMAEVLAKNPFADAPGNRTVAIFLDSHPAPGALEAASGGNDERMRLGAREIYVHYPSGVGQSKLKIPAAKFGTTRNMNTVAKLTEMARKIA